MLANIPMWNLSEVYYVCVYFPSPSFHFKVFMILIKLKFYSGKEFLLPAMSLYQ